MDSNEVLRILTQIGDTPSRNEKDEIVERYVSDPMFQMVVSFAYDPFITFGLTPPKCVGEGTMFFDKDSTAIWGTLRALAGRTITGNEAFEIVKETLILLNESSSELLWRILSKDLRCGITGKTINRMLPGTIPSFDVMLAHKYEEKHIKKWPVSVEPKLDGVRLICLVKDGKAQFFSRSGKPFPAVDHLREAVLAMMNEAVDKLKSDPASYAHDYRRMLAGHDFPRIALDGEIVSGSFNKTVGDIRRKSEAANDAEFHIFDALPYDAFTDLETKTVDVDYVKRRSLARYLVDRGDPKVFKLVPSELANSDEQIQALYKKYRDEGLEGAIVKPRDGIYSKKRSRAWLKIKAEESLDLKVIDAFEGTGKYVGMLGGLVVDNNGVDVRVGGGFSDEQRSSFWKAFCEDRREDSLCEHSGAEFSGTKPAYQLIGRLIEVEYHELTPDGSLRHPRFVKWRDDKETSTIHT